MEMVANLDILRRLAASRIPVSATHIGNRECNSRSIEETLAFPIVEPDCVAQLLEHQVDDVERMKHVLRYGDRVCNTSPPGTGKTFNAAAIARELGLPLMVISPKSVIPMWYEVASDWGVPIISITNYDMARSSHSDTQVKWYDMRNGWTDSATVCPWIRKEKVITRVKGEKKETVLFHWNLPYKCVIVFDEEHSGKNTHTLNFALIEGAVRASKRQGHKLIFLSATPIEKSVNLKSIVYFLGLVSKPDMNSVNRFFKETIGSNDNLDIHNYLYDIDIHSDKPPRGMITTMPDAKVPEGISNDVQAVTYEMDDETTKKISEKNREILIARERLKRREYESTLGTINANRNFIESYKVPLMVNLASDALTGNNPEQKKYHRVNFFVQFKTTLHSICEKMKEELRYLASLGLVPRDAADTWVSTLHGDQHNDESKLSIANFNSGKTRILISTISKGGQSLSLHDTIGNMETFVIISPPTSAIALRQCLGRTWRATVKSSVKQVIVFTKGDPIEESIRAGLNEKLKEQAKFTEGRAKCNFELYELAKLPAVAA